MKFAVLLIAALNVPASAAHADEISVTELSKDVFVLKSVSYGTNIGLIKTAKGIVLVDPMPGEGNLDALSGAVTGLVGGPVAFILNTHGHEDHAGGNAYFSGKGGVLLEDASAFADIREVSLTSHSTGDKVFFHEKSNSIFVGDIYDTSWHPTFYAGGLSGFDNAVEAILTLGNEESTIVPGHGRPTGKAGLRAFRKNTLDWVSRVRELKNEGMTPIKIKEDAQIQRLLGKFNLDNKADFVPEKAFVRFIERTLAVLEAGV